MGRPDAESTPLIGRIWRGRVPRERLEEYLAYNREHGLREIAVQPGCVGVQQFSSVDGDVAEVTTISYWASTAAMTAMHGDDRPSHLPRDAEFLLELPERVTLVDVHVNQWHERNA
jgi:hypothetical protein